MRSIAALAVQRDGVNVGRLYGAEPARVEEAAHRHEDSQLIDGQMRGRQLAPVDDALVSRGGGRGRLFRALFALDGFAPLRILSLATRRLRRAGLTFLLLRFLVPRSLRLLFRLLRRRLCRRLLTRE